MTPTRRTRTSTFFLASLVMLGQLVGAVATAQPAAAATPVWDFATQFDRTPAVPQVDPSSGPWYYQHEVLGEGQTAANRTAPYPMLDTYDPNPAGCPEGPVPTWHDS